MNKQIVRAARVRFKVAALSRYGATGLTDTDSVARVIESRTRVPFAAVVANQWREDRTPGRYLSVVPSGERFVANLCDE